MRVREGVREGEGKRKPPQHAQSKKTKRLTKSRVTFANVGTMLRDIYIYTLFFILFSIIAYYKILSIVPCVV